MEFDLYFRPPSLQEIEERRAVLKSRRKKALIFFFPLLALWAAALWLLLSLKFLDQNTTLAIGGGMLAIVLLTRLTGGARAAVSVAACILAALVSTVAILGVQDRGYETLLAIYSGVGGGFLLGALFLMIGSQLRNAQEGLRELKPIPEKKKAHAAIVELGGKHPVVNAYRRNVNLSGRPLVKGEIATMKKWAEKAERSAPISVPVEEAPEQKVAPAPEPPVEAPVRAQETSEEAPVVEAEFVADVTPEAPQEQTEPEAVEEETPAPPEQAEPEAAEEETPAPPK